MNPTNLGPSAAALPPKAGSHVGGDCGLAAEGLSQSRGPVKRMRLHYQRHMAVGAVGSSRIGALRSLDYL
jgi:hypothetical protein